MDAADVVLAALEELGLGPDEVDLALDPDLPPLLADPVLLQRVLVNVLANAVRHAPDGTRVRVDVPPRPRHGAAARRSTTARACRERSATTCSRPSSGWETLDNTAGLGLGLALSKGFTEGMGGSLTPGGHPGGRPHHGDLAAARLGTGGSAMRILVADDDPQLVRALRITLAAHGYDVVAAPDGAAAIALAAKAHPDIVMVDLGMPRLDGVQVIQALRGWTAAPIIVVSGRTGSADKVEALDAGADDFVTKPFQIDELLARLRALYAAGRAGVRTSRPSRSAMSRSTSRRSR